MIPGARAEAAARVHVHGTAHLDAHAARANGKLVLSGTVTDDVSRPLSGAHVALVLARESGDGSLRGATVPLSSDASAQPEACDGSSARPALEGADRLILPTDDSGRFCVRIAVATDRYVAHLEARGPALVDVARIDLPIDLALKPVTLRFDPEPVTLSLDDETTALDVLASTEEDGVKAGEPGLALLLSNETGARLAEATTTAGGRARFVLRGASFGAPGKGELRVTFGGNHDAGASTHAIAVERRTRVDLSIPGVNGTRLPSGAPEDGIAIHVTAKPRCARAGCAGSPTGTVEAQVGETLVGAGPIRGGDAVVVMTFGLPATNDVAVRLRYVPDAPWWESAGELALVQPVRQTSFWRKLPLLVAGLAVVTWLAMTRLSARARGRIEPRSSEAPDRAGERLEIVRTGAHGGARTGRVVDAYDAKAVANAEVRIERRGFDRLEVIVRATTDAAGAFVLPSIVARPGDELVAEGPWHAPVRRPLPPPSELQIALVSRRRALVDRLVAWARRRGAPFDATPDPTPGHVRRAAGVDTAVVRWADAVEQAAYGGGTVDARAQADVDRLAPGEAEPLALPDGMTKHAGRS